MSYLRKAFSTLIALCLFAIATPATLAEEAAKHAAEHDSTPAAESKTPVKTKLKIAKTDTTIHVGSLHCKTCAKKIARKLYTVKSVAKVRSDVKANVVVITPQSKKQLDVKKLWDAATKAGFAPVKLVGPDGTFKPDEKTKAPVLAPEKVAAKQQ
jgi:copper chaperone CopZ